ncbi:hypothetical protein B5X24_HaOG200744 [Helicoverpa armigera]|uniref:Gustatory receptor n=1 Tax=Helicoverpa armigera TaxID=29058 RepID=A0A2W1BTY8_HELAM|nr:hypothetical protein B5X24_HaOG200744 [Helicoverpa armigera]
MWSCFKQYWLPHHRSVIIENTSSFSPDDIIEYNRIEEDLQAILRPLNFMENIFLCAKYSIRRQYITSNSRIYNFFRVFCIILNRCFHTNQIIDWNITVWNERNTTLHFYSTLCVSISGFIGYMLYLTGDSVSTVSNIVLSRYNILLALKIQCALSSLRINRSQVTGIIICSWCCVIISNIYSISWVIFYCCYYGNINIVTIVTAYASISYEISVAYAFILIKLTDKLLQQWINECRALSLEDSENVENVDKLFIVYCDIQEIYMIIEKTFQHLVSFEPS